MIFVDTSAIYAWTDAADANHQAAVQRLQTILEDGEELLTHNYVLLESIALVEARLGVAAAIKVAADSAAFALTWVDEELHLAGIAALNRSKKRHLSLVDHISFLVMRRRRVSTAFAFDPDYTSEGFRLFDA